MTDDGQPEPTWLRPPPMPAWFERQLSMLDLEPVPHARHSDPATSHEAARDVAPRAGTDRARALTVLEAAGARGATDFELADALGRQQTSIGKRRHELVGLGLVEWAGTHRPAPSGAKAMVWRVR